MAKLPVLVFCNVECAITRWDVVVFEIQEHDDICILLYLPGFSQARQRRRAPAALFGTAELRERNDRYPRIPAQLLEGKRDICDLLISVAPGGVEQLKVVNDYHVIAAGKRYRTDVHRRHAGGLYDLKRDPVAPGSEGSHGVELAVAQAAGLYGVEINFRRIGYHSVVQLLVARFKREYADSLFLCLSHLVCELRCQHCLAGRRIPAQYYQVSRFGKQVLVKRLEIPPEVLRHFTL